MKRLHPASVLVILSATLTACLPPPPPPGSDAAPDVNADAAPDTATDAPHDATPEDVTVDAVVNDAAPEDVSSDVASDAALDLATPDIAAPDVETPDVATPEDAGSADASLDAPDDVTTEDATDASVDAPSAPAWTVAVENATGTSSTQLRAVAVSRTSAPSVYVGFIQTSNTPAGRTVRRYDAAPPYALLGELGPGTSQPKALDTDDRGNVFIAYRYSGTSGSELVSASADLRAVNPHLDVGTPVVGGLCVRREGDAYRAYVTYEGDGLVRRYDITDPARMALDTTFGAGGSFQIPTAGELRGCAFDAEGNLWVASRAGGVVFRVTSDLRVTGTATIAGAFDVAFRGERAYVTAYRGAESSVRVLDARTMAPVDELTPARLGFARGSREGYAGLDVSADGRLWVADEDYDGASPVRDRLLVSPTLP